MNKAEIRKLELADMAKLLDTDFGRRVMYRVLAKCGTYGSVAVGNGLALEEAHAVWYRAGRQDLGHFWMDELASSNPEGVKKMTDEAHARKLQERLEVGRQREEIDV